MGIYSETKNKETLSSPGRFGFLTEPMQTVLLILNFTIVFVISSIFRGNRGVESESEILLHL